MLRTALGTLLLVIVPSCALSQQWEATRTGPGSSPGTHRVEISGIPHDTGECGADPLGACLVAWQRVEWMMTPCALAAGTSSYCESGSTYGILLSAPLFERFSWEVEVQEGVTYTLTATWEFLALMSSGVEEPCDSSSVCEIRYNLDPETLQIAVTVPVSTVGWSVMKTRYRDD